MRCAKVAVALLVVVVVVCGVRPRPAVAVPRPLGALALPNPLPPLGHAVGGLAGGLARDSANTALDAVAAWVSAGAASLLGSLASEIDRTTSADVAHGWMTNHFDTMTRVAILFALPLLFAAAITAVVSRDAGILLRATFVHLPLAIVGTAVAIALVDAALAATDELCSVVTSQTHPDTTALLRGLTRDLARGGPGVTGFGLVLVSLLIAFGGFFLTLELVLRSAAIWVALLFLPLGLIGLVWPGTARWGRRLAELLVVLILSKFVIVAIVSMAVSATSAGANSPDGPSLLGGAALLILAAAAPFTLLRMVPLVEAGIVAHMDGLSHRATSLPPVARQAVHQQALGRLLDGRGPDGGPPSGPAGPPPGSSTPLAVPTRGRDPDGTQSGADKPVPASPPATGVATASTDWHAGVRLIDQGADGGIGAGARAAAGPVTPHSPTIPPPRRDGTGPSGGRHG
jgi:hypothetical protein